MKKVYLPSFLFLFLGLQIIFLLPSCAVNPVTGKKDFMVMSEKREKSLGLSYDPQVVGQMGLYEDKKLQAFINQKGQEMAKVSHRPNLGYKFQIVDSPVVNAFAVPGGFVYFTRGIMAHFNNEAEFAGVLGHEIGHITARHSAKQMRNATWGQIGLIASAIAFPKEFQQFGETAQQSLGLLFLKFGRDAESQSDMLGVDYSSHIGYDAKEMAGFFNTIHRISAESGQSVPTFLSTHPDPLDRNKKVTSMAIEEQKKSNKKYKVGRDSYLKMIDGLLYGDDPKQGYVEGNVFYHPELRFQFPVPNGWKTANSPSQFQMGAPDGKAAIILSLAAETSLEAAAQAVLTNNQLTKKQQNFIKVNGLNAISLISTKPNELELLTYLIQYNGKIYKLHGLSTPIDFNRNVSTFRQVFDKFKKLTDSSKINKLPERIKIVKASSSTTLKQVFTSNRQDSKRFNELAILNGMELNDRVQSGMLIKVIEEKR